MITILEKLLEKFALQYCSLDFKIYFIQKRFYEAKKKMQDN